LLTAPREQTREQREHLESCESCARLQRELDALEPQLEEAALVPVPDALAHRILHAQRGRRFWHFASAAFVALAVGISVLAVPAVSDLAPFRRQVDAVGPAHPAVAAISLVADERLELPQSGDAAEMAQELKRLGLTLKGDAYAYYAGKCRLADTECDLIVVSTPDAYANVVLLSAYSPDGRIVVEDREMTALVNPAGAGAYIVVARSPAVAKRIDRLFVRG
jgi:hypothetical protein